MRAKADRERLVSRPRDSNRNDDQASVISISGLRLTAGSEPRKRVIIPGLDIDIREGEFLGIVGELGSGKSTLLYSIANYLSPGLKIEVGRIMYRDRDILGMRPDEKRALRGRSIAVVYQDPSTSLTPSMKVGVQIAEVRSHHFGEAADAARKEALQLLAAVDLSDAERIYDSFPHELSGGQRQRIVIAMALAGEPDLLLLDEPTTALDVIVQLKIFEVLRKLQKTMLLTAILVSHDLGVVASVADRIGVLYGGRLMEIGPTSKVLGQPESDYTRTLLGAIPSIDSVGPAGQSQRAPRKLIVAAAPPESAQKSDSLVLSVQDVAIDYGRRGGFGQAGERSRAVDGVTFEIRTGRVTALVGESGSGKSSIARAIVGLEACTAGRIALNGRDIAGFGAVDLRSYRQRVQMVFQNPSGSLNPAKTIGDLICRPMRLAGIDKRTATIRACELLDAVELDRSFMTRGPRQLSGGEKQRVAIARVFATSPSLIVLDEPTTALDVSVQAGILNLLKQLQAETNCGYLLISHDLAVVRQLADDVIVMRSGRICEAGSIDDVFEHPQSPYAQTLVAAARQMKRGASPAA